MNAPDALPWLLVAFLMVAVLILTHTARTSAPELPPTPDPDVTIDELIRTIRQQLDRQHEVSLMLAGAIERIATPSVYAAEPPTPIDDPHELDIDLEVPWDPTDADPMLADSTYRDIAAVRTPVYANTPPDIITHPLGIPGLQVPYPPHLQPQPADDDAPATSRFDVV